MKARHDFKEEAELHFLRLENRISKGLEEQQSDVTNSNHWRVKTVEGNKWLEEKTDELYHNYLVSYYLPTASLNVQSEWNRKGAEATADFYSEAFAEAVNMANQIISNE